jgi:hypothetical protein
MTNPNADANWQEPSLAALRAVQLDHLPSFEVLLIDDLAGYLMGAGPLAEPYTVENGSRVVTALFGAMINATKYTPNKAPEPTAAMTSLRENFVQGAHAFADLGVAGLGKLVNRLVMAAVGELELHKDDAAEQTESLFYYTLLAVASGPLNLLAVQAADGAEELFVAWDQVFGEGLVLPWRQPST